MEWINRARYTDMSQSDMENNILKIWEVLQPLGWTMNAVAGISGCIQRESHFDPWAWQGNNIQSTAIMLEDNPRGRAYGLIQWDSCNNYLLSPIAQAAYGYAPNFSDRAGGPNDGDAQLTLINTGEGYYATTNYPERFSEYKASDKGADYLAAAWLYNRQRPGSGGSTEALVRENGLKWYDFLLTAQPGDYYVVTVGAYPAAAGHVTGGGTVQKGSSTTIFAVANEGYTFSHFKIGGQLVRENPYTFTPTANTAVLAIFTGGSEPPFPPIEFGRKMPIPLYLKQHRRMR